MTPITTPQEALRRVDEVMAEYDYVHITSSEKLVGGLRCRVAALSAEIAPPGLPDELRRDVADERG